MSNPVMDRNPYFKQSAQRPNQFPNQYQQTTQYAEDYSQQYSPQGYVDAQAQSYSPYAGADRMTYADAMNKTALLLGTTIFAGVLAILFFPIAAMPMLAIGGSLVAFGIGMFIAFQPMVKPGMAIAYAAIEGVALGSITRYLDYFLPGVALQAILATAVIVAVTLGLHYSGAIRTTPRGRKIVLIVALGGILFGFINMGLMLFTRTNLRTDVAFGGMPLGVIIGVVMLFVAAYFLIADFEAVQDAINNGAPAQFAWTCAIGIVMTILWIYVEVLRIVAILADR
ncbi:Bax inhibitor-1/YccA family membrane protein [Arcanobacterium bovis]|uniref:Bax inhibitor-1/YccA family protein n=1 Tax=Arcanobacterium bovis TaxID=2529275 RepID=A0A4Q9V268_9ACTO|nr:Bax inhibitor-1/YccA family protein [Arcanobacterium bovis]TBW23700.1 Bax inhibitor-1/YccA family protein [Arcanobacterium bovis]